MTDSAVSLDEVDDLRRQIQQLTAENEELRGGAARPRHPSVRIRAIVSVAMIVIASLLVPVGVLGVWIRRQLTDTDRYVETVAPLVRDDSIRSAAAARVTAALVKGVDLDTRVSEALPADAAFLSAPIAAGIENLVREVVGRVVASDQFAQLWDEANRLAHEQVVSVLTNRTDRAGVVEIDLSAVAAEASRRLEERGITSLADVSGRPLTFTLVESDSIARLQGAFTVFDGVARTLPWIVIVLYAAAVYVATDRRRAAARVGTGIIAGALGLLIVLAVARGAYLGALPAGSSRSANEAIFDTLTRFLRGGGRTVLSIGVVMLCVAVAAGPGRGAAWLRRTTAQWLDRAGTSAGHHGMDFGQVGTFVSSNVRALRFAVVMLGVVVLLSVDRPSGGTVLWVAIGSAAALLTVDFVARMARPDQEAAVPTDSAEPTLPT